jgi:hypothetical protein
MSRNGSGTYTLPAGNPVVTGTTISSTWANSTLTNIASALTDSLAADGQTTATGNLKMGNNRITGLADGIADTDAATVGQSMIIDNMPAFGYYQSVDQSMTAGVYTKITFTTSEFDTTSGMYASSRFTPTVAGYYQVNASFNIATTFTGGTCVIYKNGSGFKQGSVNLNGGNKNSSGWTVSSIIYCNGSTDYLEVYGQINDTQNTFALQPVTYFNACLMRAA